MSHCRTAWIAVVLSLISFAHFTPTSYAQGPSCKADKTLGLFEYYPIDSAVLESGADAFNPMTGLIDLHAGLIPQGNAHSSLHLNPVGHMYFHTTAQVCTMDNYQFSACDRSFSDFDLFAPADLEIESVYHWQKQSHDYLLTQGSQATTHVDYDMYTIGFNFTCSVSGYINGVTDLDFNVTVEDSNGSHTANLKTLVDAGMPAGMTSADAWNAQLPKIKISKGTLLSRFRNYDTGIDFGIKDQRFVHGRTLNLAWNRELEFLHHRPFTEYYVDPLLAAGHYLNNLPQHHPDPGPWRQDHPESLQGLWFSKPLIDYSPTGGNDDRDVGERGVLTIVPYFKDKNQIVLAWGAAAPVQQGNNNPTPTPSALLDPASWNLPNCTANSLPSACDAADRLPVEYTVTENGVLNTYTPNGLAHSPENEFTSYIKDFGTALDINPFPSVVNPSWDTVCYDIPAAYQWKKNGNQDFTDRRDYVLFKMNPPSRPGIYDQTLWVRYYPLAMVPTAQYPTACALAKANNNGHYVAPPADDKPTTPQGLWKLYRRGIKPQMQSFHFPVDPQSAMGATNMSLANPAKGEAIPDFSDVVILNGWETNTLANSTDVRAMASGEVFLIEKRISSTRTLYDVYISHPNSVDHTTMDEKRPGLVTVTKDLDSVPFNFSGLNWVSAADFNLLASTPTTPGRYWMMLGLPASSAINPSAATIHKNQDAVIGQAHRMIRVSVIDQSATNGSFFYPSKMRYAGPMEIWGSYNPLASLDLTSPFTPSSSAPPSTSVSSTGFGATNRFPIAHHTQSGDGSRPYWFLGNPYVNSFSIFDYLPESDRAKMMGYDAGFAGSQVPGRDQSDSIIGTWFNPALDGNEYPSIDAHAGALTFWYNRWSDSNHLEPLIAFGTVDSVQIAANKGLAQLDPRNRPACGQGQTVDHDDCVTDPLTWDKRRFRSGSSYSVSMAAVQYPYNPMFRANPDLRNIYFGDVACFDLRPENNMLDEDQNADPAPGGYDVLIVRFDSDRELKAFLIASGGAANETCATRITQYPPDFNDPRWKTYRR